MLWPVLMFWSLVIVALILFCLGFWLKRASPAFVGAVIATPFCLLVSGYGFPFWLGGPIALASIFGSAGLLKGRRRGVAMLALIPFVLVVFGLAYIVINQEPPLSTRIVRRQEVSGRRLAYRVVRMERGQLTGIVNEERFAWNDVRVEVGSGSQSFLCDTPRTVDSRDILSLESLMCRAADGSVLSRLCVVRLTAREGHVNTAFEPCVRVD